MFTKISVITLICIFIILIIYLLTSNKVKKNTIVNTDKFCSKDCDETPNIRGSQNGTLEELEKVRIRLMNTLYNIYLEYISRVTWEKNKQHGKRYKIGENKYINKEPLNLVFTINPSSNFTYVKDKKDIYMVFVNEQIGKIYPFTTLILVGIHELAHILNKTNHHNQIFYKIEQDLIDIAFEMELFGSLDDDRNHIIEIDPNYPCVQ